jgi:L-aspartate oxidase
MNPDFLVIGAGVAGLRAAIELAESGRVLVVAKGGLRESSSEYAQGGIAVALSDDDEVELHEQNTLFADDGLCDRAAVHTLVEEGPAAIQQLIDWGAEFDRVGGALAFTREGAHSRNRVLHAHGDSTGHEIARSLYQKAASLPNIAFRGYAATIDLLVSDASVSGALLYPAGAAEPEAVIAHSVLLATGGLGCVFRNTTNPDVATGDGVAMAYRAGAAILDIEFVQFHPTALCLEGAPRFLLSEALRGEGAQLRNTAGDRFMARYHPMAELAPRDVVARAIVAEMSRTGASHVLLDLTHRGPEFIRARFPRIYETCARYGVDIATQPAPVAPAAHYAMGGVRTDLDGPVSRACLAPAKRPARGSTEPIAWPAIRCWKAWSSARAPAVPCARRSRAPCPPADVAISWRRPPPPPKKSAALPGITVESCVPPRASPPPSSGSKAAPRSRVGCRPRIAKRATSTRCSR